MVQQSLRDRAKRTWKAVRNFDYKDLGFLYLACLVTVAVVFSIFRASQFYLNRSESALLETLRNLEEQRDLVASFERLIVVSQDENSPEFRSASEQLPATFEEILQRQEMIMRAEDELAEICGGRPCEDLQEPAYTYSPETLSAALDAAGTGKVQGPLMRRLFAQSLAYHGQLKEAIERSIVLLHGKNRADSTFDSIAYLSLLLLLAVQGIYIFGPAIRKLNASLSTRSDFLSRISHEIRNPMNSIIGMADILKGTKLNFEQGQYVDNLLRSGHALLDMLNNLIDFSSIEGGKLTLKPGPFDLFDALDRCLHLIAIQAHHKNLNVYVDVDPDVPNRLDGDNIRLEQVLINLLKNAVKFTEQGHVRLIVRVEGQTDGSAQLMFAVEDTGIGIKQDQLGEIFESFVQADSSIQRKYGGSGLGLSISSELIRLMGGQLSVTSELGSGSRFFFSIRLLKQAPRTDTPSTPLTSLADEKFHYLTAQPERPAYDEMFNRLKAPAEVMSSAQELRAALERPGGQVPSEILIDDSVGIISMINCRNAADQHHLSDRVVGCIRSNFTKENMDLLRRNGFERFLIKPLKPWDLLELPGRVEDGATDASGNRSFITKLKEKNLRMLLVDDSNDNLFLLREVVQPLASTIHFAENGLEAIEKFGHNSYDVVFMDIQMPVMDGYTAIRKMRQMELGRGHNMPIFAVTAHAGLVDAQKCREAGFTDRIVKPVVRSDIYKTLSKVFALDFAELEEEKDTGSLPDKYLNKLIPTYLKTRFEDVAKLKAALQSADFQAVAQLGHKIKGSAASYGFPRVSEKAHQMELAAKDSDLERCARLGQELEGMFLAEKERRQL